MGTSIRVLVGAPAAPGLPAPQAAADAVVALLADYEARLSRFRPDSELARLNADPRATVPASGLLRAALRTALEAAERTGGLVDPTLLPGLEAAGYRASWDPARRLPLREALRGARPPARPASAHPGAVWRRVVVDDAARTVTRPPGVRLDTGGTGKGHAADLAADLLGGYDAWAVDCGGDLRIGGEGGRVRDVEVEDPFSGEPLTTVRVRAGAVATSGLRSRLWRGDDGEVAHHLLDPATGTPAFTGLVAVTALAPTGAEAEALAKAALLSGPERAAAILARHGGIAVDEDGRPRWVGRLEPPPRVRLRLPHSPTTTRSAA
jgi:thiamine biosynthesis lipoprotein